MQRKETGRYKTISIVGERVRAFVPAPLPPEPALMLDGSFQRLLETAVLALARISHQSCYGVSNRLNSVG